MKQIVALHGFLGAPSDWKAIKQSCENAFWHLLDLFHDDSFAFERGLACVGQMVNDKVGHNRRNNVIVGYSLGGRIALHAMKENPGLWSAAVLISAHPGLASEKERAHRLVRDKIWAEKFLSDPWDALMQEWNDQAVFCGHAVERKSCDLSRSILSRALLDCSLAKQEDLRDFLRLVDIPILWLIGERDKAATSIFEEIDFKHPCSKKVLLQSAGHRLLWEAPARVSEEISKFLETATAGKSPCKRS